MLGDEAPTNVVGTLTLCPILRPLISLVKPFIQRAV